MNPRKRFALALVIVLSGLLLVPFVALPKESFRWQTFAGAYGAESGAGLNHDNGGPGSYFLLSGFGFTPGATLTLRVNGVTFGTVDVDSNGRFSVLLNTAGAGLGRYVIEVDDTPAGDLAAVVATTSFELLPGAPVRPAVEGDTTLAIPNVPAALAGRSIWLPYVTR